MMKESPYDSIKSKHEDSQNDILLYNSMKKEENDLKFIPTMKRQSKDGDFAKASHSVIESFNYDEDDLSEEEEHKPPSNKVKVQNQNVYYEPKTLKNNKRSNLKEKQQFGHDMQNFKQNKNETISKTISNDDIQNYQNTNYKDALKIPKATKASERIKANSKFLNANTYIEKKIDNSLGNEFKFKDKGEQNSQQKDRNLNLIEFNGNNPNESMSSNHSSLNKSLKMQSRRQKRQLREAMKTERIKKI